MKISYSIIALSLILISCKTTDDFFRSYLDYEIEIPADTSGKQVLKSNRTYALSLNKNGSNHEFSGSDSIINFKFEINTESKEFINTPLLYINKNAINDSNSILIDDLTLKSYKSYSQRDDLEILFNRYFTISMTTNTTTSTVVKPGILKLKIVE